MDNISELKYIRPDTKQKPFSKDLIIQFAIDNVEKSQCEILEDIVEIYVNCYPYLDYDTEFIESQNRFNIDLKTNLNIAQNEREREMILENFNQEPFKFKKYYDERLGHHKS